MSASDPIITEARAAWTRIKGRDKASFEDWFQITRDKQRDGPGCRRL
ncbi:hypothetical protein [Bradyrhizobium symbiodeficiens]|nr:hypothetical protein [Bradyrhizobium symbiodeficiens]